MEWWSGGVVEWWSGGVVEWWGPEGGGRGILTEQDPLPFYARISFATTPSTSVRRKFRPE
ncbi:MAG: hypothetical protein K0Q72_2285 [Armatimonadetes bacterium]|jgi:hypothetical protein|nr:hypothetical protein [Armatimonadota bacterium]